MAELKFSIRKNPNGTYTFLDKDGTPYNPKSTVGNPKFEQIPKEGKSDE